jgi:hypothetical protein
MISDANIDVGFWGVNWIWKDLTGHDVFIVLENGMLTTSQFVQVYMSVYFNKR